jgi:hypothetical protein
MTDSSPIVRYLDLTLDAWDGSDGGTEIQISAVSTVRLFRLRPPEPSVSPRAIPANRSRSERLTIFQEPRAAAPLVYFSTLLALASLMKRFASSWRRNRACISSAAACSTAAT